MCGGIRVPPPKRGSSGAGYAAMAIRLNISTLFYLALTASAIFMLRAEVSAFAGAGAQGVIVELPDSPFSMKAYHAVLMRCDRAMAVPLSRLQPENRQLTTARACGRFANATICHDADTRVCAFDCRAGRWR